MFLNYTVKVDYENSNLLQKTILWTLLELNNDIILFLRIIDSITITIQFNINIFDFNSTKEAERVTKKLKLETCKCSHIVTHITAKFASLVSHRHFCYIYLARLTISRHLSKQ